MRIAGSLIAAALLLAACGSDGDVDPEPYVDAVKADIASSDGPDDLGLDDEAAQCVAEALVGAADVERLDEADISPEDFAAAESFEALELDADEDELRSDLTSGLSSCPLGGPLTDVFVSEFPFELTDENRDCVVGFLEDSEELDEGIAATLVNGDDAGLQDALVLALADCPSVTGDLLAETITQAGVPVDDTARQCLTDEMGARGEEAVRQLIEGGQAANDLGVQLGEACLAG